MTSFAEGLANSAPALAARSRGLLSIFAGVLIGNVMAWDWAFTAGNGSFAFLGTAVLAYGLGLRHGVDADHIAAIDNATRRLMQRGEKPVAVGLFFALGHSTVVIVACAAIAFGSAAVRARVPHVGGEAALIGTVASVGFLFVIAAANLVTLSGIWRAWAAHRRGSSVIVLPVAGGMAPRLLGPLMRVVTRSWHMALLGFLFGLGFDTASEVALLAISAGQAAHHVSLWAVMALPVLFTAGMALVDTTDGALMVGAYGWALVQPMRKLAYNLVVTLISVLVALVVGSLQILNLVGRSWDVADGSWRWVALANQHFGLVGCAIIVTLTGCWAASALAAHRRRRAEGPPPGATEAPKPRIALLNRREGAESRPAR